MTTALLGGCGGGGGNGGGDGDPGIDWTISGQVLWGGAVTISDCRIICHDQLGVGVLVQSGCHLNLARCEMAGGRIGVRVAQIVTTARRTMIDMTDTSFSNCYWGIYALDAAKGYGDSDYSLSVDGCEISGNLYGIEFDGTPVAGSTPIGDLTLRGTAVTGNSTGVRVHGGNVNLGGASAPGENRISGNTVVNLHDQRAAGAATLPAMGNTWDDPQPSGTITGPITTKNYKIDAATSIRFS